MVSILLGGGVTLEWTDVVRVFVTVGVPLLVTGFVRIIKVLNKIYKTLEQRIDHTDQKIDHTDLKIDVKVAALQEDVNKKHAENKQLIEHQGDIVHKFLDTVSGPLNRIADVLTKNREAT